MIMCWELPNTVDLHNQSPEVQRAIEVNQGCAPVQMIT